MVFKFTVSLQRFHRHGLIVILAHGIVESLFVGMLKIIIRGSEKKNRSRQKKLYHVYYLIMGYLWAKYKGRYFWTLCYSRSQKRKLLNASPSKMT